MGDDDLQELMASQTSGEVKNPQKALAEIAQLPIPHLYANGFAMIMGLADVSVLVMRNNVPQAEVSFSLPVLKQLARALNKVIEDYERTHDTTISDPDELIARLPKQKE